MSGKTVTFTDEQIEHLKGVLKKDAEWTSELEAMSEDADRDCAYEDYDERRADYGEWAANQFVDLLAIVTQGLGLKEGE